MQKSTKVIEVCKCGCTVRPIKLPNKMRNWVVVDFRNCAVIGSKSNVGEMMDMLIGVHLSTMSGWWGMTEEYYPYNGGWSILRDISVGADTADALLHVCVMLYMTGKLSWRWRLEVARLLFT